MGLLLEVVRGREVARIHKDHQGGIQGLLSTLNRKFLPSSLSLQIIPADLNGLLHLTALHIADFSEILGELHEAEAFRQQAEQLRLAMDDLMWCEEAGSWHDLLLTASAPGERRFRAERIDDGARASDWVPLWCRCCEPGGERARAAVSGLAASGLVGPGGVLTTLSETGQQWDAPNAWAPLQHMLIMGLRGSGTPEGEALAADIAQAWIRSNAEAYRATGYMHEKYNALRPGSAGGGGEYEPQVGFGWSNGVVLELLRLYPDQTPRTGVASNCLSQ